MKPGSLHRRLLWAALAWIVGALAAAAVVLGVLFRDHVEAALAERMQGHLDQLIAALQIESSGDVRLTKELSEPLFRQPYSGWYWIVQRGATPLLRSRSLWDFDLKLPAPGAATGVQRIEAAGPRGQALVFWARSVQLPGANGPLLVATGADASRLDAMTRSFARTLAASLAVVALALMLAAALQVRLGLAPLRRMHAALLAMRSGQATRVEGRFPVEVQPLVDDLHGLLDENEAIVARARAQTGDLAHALKTPLAVITNAAQQLPGPDGELIRAQAARMARQVELGLMRSRASARARTRGRGSPVRAAVDDLRRALERLYAERGLQFTVHEQGQPHFPGDPQDLQEMLGNLLDNAARWSRRQVHVNLGIAGNDLVCDVEDDGPGIEPSARALVLQRGERLDESKPGAGLGLAIVDDLARLHGGSLQLGESRLGGLHARLVLPATAGR